MINGSELNKLQNTKVGDTINYYVNGTPMSGVVTAMSGSFINVAKDNMVRTIRIDDTFFVKDIIMKNKSWNEMTMEEKGEALVNVKAYSPRFLSKTWEQLPQELKDALKGGGFRSDKVRESHGNVDDTFDKTLVAGSDFQSEKPPVKEILNSPNNATELSHGDPKRSKKLPKTGEAPQLKTASHSCDEVEKSIEKMNKEFAKLKSGVEQGAYGNTGSRPFIGVSTQMDIDASEDYEGATHNDFKEQFKHEKQKPETTMEGHNKKKDSSVSTGTTGVFNATNSSGEKKEEEE